METHAEMGEQLLPWVIALAVGIVLFMVFARLTARHSTDGPPPAWAPRWVVVVVTVIAASGALVQVARIGHSGAKASWSDAAGVARPGGEPTPDRRGQGGEEAPGRGAGASPFGHSPPLAARAVALGAGAVNTARAVRVREPPAVSACSYADDPAESPSPRSSGDGSPCGTTRATASAAVVTRIWSDRIHGYSSGQLNESTMPPSRATGWLSGWRSTRLRTIP